jgi:hypothetical protein
MKETLANYIVTKKKTKNGKVYTSPRIYLPTKLTSDSGFPFKGDTKVLIRIKGRKLIVEKASKRVLEKYGVTSEERSKQIIKKETVS